MFALNTPPPMVRSLRVLAALLGYPDARMRGYLPVMRALLRDERDLSQARCAELDSLIASLQPADPLQPEAE